MLDLFKWIMEYWKSILNIGLVILLFSLVPGLTTTFRNAKQGVKEAVTPMGFFVMIIVIIIFFVIKNYIGQML
jgi:vacuolar-type H+-ATPase subunit I/STV1